MRSARERRSNWGWVAAAAVRATGGTLFGDSRRGLAVLPGPGPRAGPELSRLRAALLRTEPDFVLLKAEAVVVGLRGDVRDLRLLREARETDFDTACGLAAYRNRGPARTSCDSGRGSSTSRCSGRTRRTSPSPHGPIWPGTRGWRA